MKSLYYITKTDSIGYENIDAIALKLMNIDMILDKELKYKLEVSDSIIVTSKNSIIFLDRLDIDNWKKKPIYCIGDGIKKALADIGISPFYVSTKPYGNDFAIELVELLQDKKPLFIRAKKVASRLSEILREANIDLLESIIYETSSIELDIKPKIETNSVIFFGSPSSVNAFLLNYRWLDDYSALCIGSTTYKYIKNKIPNVRAFVSPVANIEESLKYAKNNLC